MRHRRYTVACLAGDGIGPEVMAEASRALAAVSRLHGFEAEEVHVPFGGDALRRFGHALPPETRAACRQADAILVAATKEPALEGVRAELDLSWRVMAVRAGTRGDLRVVSPLHDDEEERAVERAFRISCARRAHVSSVGIETRWHALVECVADRHPGVIVEELSLQDALPLLAEAPEHFDVVVTQRVLAEALSSMAAFVHDGTRLAASGGLSESGPGIFGPTHGPAPDIAGLGVANPSAMLLATALMLGEGLGQRAAERTIEGAVAQALQTGVRTADMASAGLAATTREFMDAVLAGLPGARTDTEFYREVLA